MLGRGALRRTVNFLEKGEILLRSNIKILMFGYCPDEKRFPHHVGLTKFVFWHLPQLKYKNPDVEMYTFQNMTPSPFIKAYYDDFSHMLIDCESRSREQIMDHLKAVLNKTEETLALEEKEVLSLAQNPANFGSQFARQCMCEVPGQVPCPCWQPLPKEMRGKYRPINKKQREEYKFD